MAAQIQQHDHFVLIEETNKVCTLQNKFELDINVDSTCLILFPSCRAKGHVEMAPTVITKLFSNSRPRNRERKNGKFQWNKEQKDSASFYSLQNKTVSSSSKHNLGDTIVIMIVTLNHILKYFM